MTRFAVHRGAEAETLTGLSGLGDLVLTATSEGSRNFRYGLALGRGERFDPAITVEGAATARAVAAIAAAESVEMPISTLIAGLAAGQVDVKRQCDFARTSAQGGMMPLYAVICRDKPGRVETRAATRPAHLDWLNAHGGVQFAGPLIEDGAPVGSLVVIEAGDLAAAKAWVATDPMRRRMCSLQSR